MGELTTFCRFWFHRTQFLCFNVLVNPAFLWYRSAYVMFADPRDAADAQRTLNRQIMGGCALSVEFDSESSSLCVPSLLASLPSSSSSSSSSSILHLQTSQPSSWSSSCSNSSSPASFPTVPMQAHSAAPSFSALISGPAIRALFVSNLAPDLREQDLEAAFGQIGRTTNVFVPASLDGKNRGSVYGFEFAFFYLSVLIHIYVLC